MLGDLARHDDIETRGGPPLELPARFGGWLWARTPEAAVFAARLWAFARTEPDGWQLEAGPAFELKLARVELELSPVVTRATGQIGWVETIDAGAPDEQVVIGRRDLEKLDVTVRGTVVLLRDLTFQTTAQALAARANYSRYRELVDGGPDEAVDYPDRDADFARTDVRLQALLRWEYLPGSTLFAVYTLIGFTDGPARSLGGSLRELADPEREQRFVLKLSHRFG